MSQVYKKIHQIRFREADPAGIMFFGNIYGICHDAFEDMIEGIGIGWDSYFNNKDLLIPLMKSEAEYRGSLVPGKHYEISIFFSQLKTSSFEITYNIQDILGPSPRICMIVKTVHVCLDAKTKAKIPLPTKWEQIFRLYYQITTSKSE